MHDFESCAFNQALPSLLQQARMIPKNDGSCQIALPAFTGLQHEKQILSPGDRRRGRTTRYGQQSTPRFFAGARRQAITEVNRVRVFRFRPQSPRRTGASPVLSAREKLFAAQPSARRARLARGFACAFPLKPPHSGGAGNREAAAGPGVVLRDGCPCRLC